MFKLHNQTSNKLWICLRYVSASLKETLKQLWATWRRCTIFQHHVQFLNQILIPQTSCKRFICIMKSDLRRKIALKFYCAYFISALFLQIVGEIFFPCFVFLCFGTVKQLFNDISRYLSDAGKENRNLNSFGIIYDYIVWWVVLYSLQNNVRYE